MISPQNYASFFENIDSETQIEDYCQFFNENISFKDPFHHVSGIEEVFAIFQLMYENLENPRFKVLEIVSQRNISYMKWEFKFNFKDQKEEQMFFGISRVVFDLDGKALSHEDFWDAAENIYEKIPIISYLIKLVKNRITSQ